jgi:hypothetical protein
LKFDDASVPRRILYQTPRREIIHDLDGSLTGVGPDSWATYFHPHLDQPECTNMSDKYDGVVCTSATTLRRIVFYGAEPNAFKRIPIKVAKWETDFEAQLEANATALEVFQ